MGDRSLIDQTSIAGLEERRCWWVDTQKSGGLLERFCWVMSRSIVPFFSLLRSSSDCFRYYRSWGLLALEVALEM